MPDSKMTNITPPRVPLIDTRTGIVSREWYSFFLSLFSLTGSGKSSFSITDLNSKIAEINALVDALDERTAGLSDDPSDHPYTSSYIPSVSNVKGALDWLAARTAGTYTFTQSIPEAVWTIPHNLGKYPVVVTIDSLDRVIEGDLSYTNENQVIVTFSGATSGKAYIS